MMGKVYLVGAGAGSYEHITLRGARLLAEADIVLADALLDPQLQSLARPGVSWVYVGKRGYRASTPQADICDQLLQAARSHAVVVRLKGGDPSLYARSEEELLHLHAHGVATEVVPGITAALAAAAQTQRPLTRRGAGRSVALATASSKETRGANGKAHAGLETGLEVNSDIANDLQPPRADTVVFYMVGQQLAQTQRKLLAQGWPSGTPVLAVSRAGYPDGKSSEHTLATLTQALLVHGDRPTVVTVGVGAQACSHKPKIERYTEAAFIEPLQTSTPSLLTTAS